MPRFETEHDGHRVEVETSNWTGKVKLLVDGQQVDSGMGFFTTLRLEDRENDIAVATDYSRKGGFARSVRLVGRGPEKEIPKVG